MLQLSNKLTCWSVTFSSVMRKDSFRVQSVNSRVMNAALIAQIQGLEKRIHFLETSVGQSHTPSDVEDPQGPRTSEKPMVGSTHLDTSVDGVQNTTFVGSAHSTSVGDAHNLNSVGDAHRCPVSKANMASQTESGGASGPYTSVSPSQMLGTKRPTIAPSYVPNQLPNPKKKVELNRKGASSAPVTSPITKPAGLRKNRNISTKQKS